MTIEIRNPAESEVNAIAQIWYDGWQDAHAALMPEELTRARTLESFRQRIAAGLSKVRVAGPLGSPLGFYMLKGEELDQLFVAAAARGTGVAAALIDDAEETLARNDVATAWLACAIGNHRAARFYEKRGWRRTGNIVVKLDIPGGQFPLEVWRYEKPLRQRAPE